LRPAANIEDTRGLVRKYESARAPHVRLDMHCAPSMVKIVGETQVEFVCASRVRKLRRAELLEERDLAVFTNGCKQRRYETRDEVLC
jgi:NADPH-dependent glutamate synthase beta subunit-like oxidoreductase